MSGHVNHLNHYYTHTIPDNNLINGKSLYYYKDCVNKDIDGASIGQIILVNCSAFNIINVSINNTDMGIIIEYSMKGLTRITKILFFPGFF